MAQKKKTTAKKVPTKKAPAKKSVYLVEISRTSSTYVYVEADSPKAAERKALDEGPYLECWDNRMDCGDYKVECVNEEDDEEPDLVAEETAPCDAAFADPAVIDGIVASMVPIPGRDYSMGKFPVTQAQWEAVMGENPSELKGADRPVENVSWIDCRNFLKKLNALPAAKASGLAFRLPTEAEWVYACRAGATGKYCKLADGTEVTAKTLGQVAWFESNAFGGTRPVGQKKPNAFGLYDMHGNVSEWTSTDDVDEYHVYWSTFGGSWCSPASDCGTSAGILCQPYYRLDHLGFRLCADRRAACNDGPPSRNDGSASRK